MNGFHFLAAAMLLAPLQAQKEAPPLPTPDVANMAYGANERNVFDLWKAPSARPTPLAIYIYGSGFVAGDKADKSAVGKDLIDECRRHGISVASINYRHATEAPYPAPMQDGARAVQYLRLHAREYNLDPKAFACTGISAGGGISLWIGFHDDMADPASADPVKRQSTRLSAMAVAAAQTTYDPRVIAKLIGEETARIKNLRTLFGLKPDDDSLTARAYFKLYEDASPVNHLTADDPPVFLWYLQPNSPLPPPNTHIGIHHPQFGLFLKEKMDKLGIECVLKLKEDYEGKSLSRQSVRDTVEFFQRHFPKQRSCGGTPETDRGHSG